MSLVARYHRFRKPHITLQGFAFDVTIRYNEVIDTVVVTDHNNGGERHVFDSAKEAGEYIVEQVVTELGR